MDKLEKTRSVAEVHRDRTSIVESNVQKTFQNLNLQSTPRDDLFALWKDLVQKQRIHEMIKCLHAGKKKMQVLYNLSSDGDADFYQFASEHQEKEKTRAQSEDASRMKSAGQSSQKEEDLERQSSSKTKLAHAHHVRARTAAEMLYNKNSITDQEFEDILELCEDKIEQKVLREAYEEKKARQKYLQNADEQREMLYNFVNSKFFTNFMLIAIITSIVGIFVLTFESISIHYAFPLMVMDACIIGIFLVEAILKIYIYKEDYFKFLWNLLDLLIIFVHFLEILVELVTRTLALSTDINETLAFKFLKSLRALRLLRVIKFLPNLQVIVATVFQSMLSIGSIAVLMLLFIFVFAVMGRGLFYERSPQKFGNLWLSFVTLFQLLTLDDWFELMEQESTQIIEEGEFLNEDEIDPGGYWLLFVYLFAYLVIEFFVFLNLFVAVLVDNFQLTLADAEIQKQKEALEELEAAQKFENMKKEGLDPNILEEEHQRQLTEIEQLGMYVEDYFPVDKDSKEAELLADLLKDMNSVDFERFMWKRRFTLFNIVADTGLMARAQAPPGEESEDEEMNVKEEAPNDDEYHDEDGRLNIEDIRAKIRKSLRQSHASEPPKKITLSSGPKRKSLQSL